MGKAAHSHPGDNRHSLLKTVFPAVEPPAGEVASIQYLRGIAALAIVFYHLAIHWQAMGWTLPHEALRGGVDLFFVISGFVMVVATDRGTRQGAGHFLLRRLVRVVPLYWAITTFTVLLLIALPDAQGSGALSPAHVLASYFFIPSQAPGGDIVPVVAVGWTLNYEMLFYAIFAFGIWAGRNRPAAVMGLVLAVLLMLPLLWFVKPLPLILRFWSQPVILEFAFGMGAALLWSGREQVRWRRILVALALIAGALLFLLPDVPTFYRFLRYGIPAALLVAVAVRVNWGFSGALHRLGDMSYSLYLSHTLVVAAFARAWQNVFPAIGWVDLLAYLALGAAASLAVGYLIWLAIERPLVKLGQGWVAGSLRPSGNARP